jgi:hypothetical protein
MDPDINRPFFSYLTNKNRNDGDRGGEFGDEEEPKGEHEL